MVAPSHNAKAVMARVLVGPPGSEGAAAAAGGWVLTMGLSAVVK
jgi:hypothetical protein